jgi:hypothetical protein
MRWPRIPATVGEVYGFFCGYRYSNDQGYKPFGLDSIKLLRSQDKLARDQKLLYRSRDTKQEP